MPRTDLLGGLLDEVGSRLRRGDVGGVGDLEVGAAERAQQRLALVGPRRRRDQQRDAPVLQVLDQPQGAPGAAQVARALEEAVGVSVRDAVRVVGATTEQPRQHAVAAHADGAVDPPHRHVVSVVGERLRPADHVVVDGVDERAVEVQQDGRFVGHRASSSGQGARSSGTSPPSSPVGPGPDEPGLVRVDDRLDPVTQVQLGQHPGDVGPDRGLVRQRPAGDDLPSSSRRTAPLGVGSVAVLAEPPCEPPAVLRSTAVGPAHTVGRSAEHPVALRLPVPGGRAATLGDPTARGLDDRDPRQTHHPRERAGRPEGRPEHHDADEPEGRTGCDRRPPTALPTTSDGPDLRQTSTEPSSPVGPGRLGRETRRTRRQGTARPAVAGRSWSIAALRHDSPCRSGSVRLARRPARRAPGAG